jgi:polysaccharide biosynthesis/export protein
MIIKLGSNRVAFAGIGLVVVLLLGGAAAQSPSTAKPAAAAVDVPSDYIIGPEDVLSVVYWFEKDLSTDVSVRPDGKISMPLLNDIQAAGLTPSQLRQRLFEESKRFVQDPNVSVVVKQINSRKAFITGEITKPGPYPLISPTTVLQLIAMAGGLKDYARSKNIIIVRNENGQTMTFPFNYKEVVTGKKLQQNIELRPGDTVIVP